MSSKCTVKKAKELNAYDIKFKLTQGELIALYNALKRYSSASTGGAAVHAYLCNSLQELSVEHGVKFPID